ncbi:acetyl-CoA carboxylase biotin carboxyl carrier protein [Salirhabdus euzebyi]|uniref:Biotin carboxyl carrier protein of acetyl-CoA carboxylase n=1 Tax=Salirhabdus euzebyi TaxID=394506 RepID=A0A841Q772_9BACI|nr:acetyl-CoA carboxylase biotin carboxyl carrier protein [Salirhabdus euzebyi]MBB6454225.1 acetyl-CoA carboxylase biotin carboxyl carrier protein [Salirhabdus euzebyi]
MKVQEIRELIKLIDESSIDEFKYESNGTKVKLKKRTVEAAAPVKEQVVVSEPVIQPQRMETSTAQTNDKPQVEQAAPVAEVKEQAPNYDQEVTSPMVGTFYRAPSPDSDPYVQVGDKVKNDSVVCIVEAMKLFNEIEAEVNGEIVEVLVEDGELVEYGQPLFRVKSK